MNNNNRKIIKTIIKQLDDIDNEVSKINFRGSNGFVLEQLYRLASILKKLQLDVDNIGAFEVQKADKSTERSGDSIITRRLEKSADLLETIVVKFDDYITYFDDAIDNLEEGKDVDMSNFCSEEIKCLLRKV